MTTEDRERDSARDRKWARERMRVGQRIMKEEMYRIREMRLSKEKGRDRDAELVRQENRVEERIGKDQQF
jgi:hypothetical protein